MSPWFCNSDGKVSKLLGRWMKFWLDPWCFVQLCLGGAITRVHVLFIDNFFLLSYH